MDSFACYVIDKMKAFLDGLCINLSLISSVHLLNDQELHALYKLNYSTLLINNQITMGDIVIDSIKEISEMLGKGPEYCVAKIS
jgi:hypothetical protein